MFYLQEKSQKKLFEHRHAMEKTLTQLRTVDQSGDTLGVIKKKIEFVSAEIQGVDNLLAKTVINEEFNAALGQNLF